MRQFDVIVWGDVSPDTNKPTFSDPDLGWFFGNDFNESLINSNAEWIIFAHSCINIDRNFLNDLAEAIDSFPMVDAFAPRIALRETSEEYAKKFFSGSILHAGLGFSELPEDAPLRFVATPHPALAAFSRRIIQRTGRMDEVFSIPSQLADYSLRMLHAGGKMFSVPYLVANSPNLEETAFHTTLSETALVLYKSFGLFDAFKYVMRHPKTLFNLLGHYKAFRAKHEAATSLSKLSEKTLKEISYAKAK